MRRLVGQLRSGEDTFATKDANNIIEVEGDSKLSFQRLLETVAQKASLWMTLLRRIRHLLDADGLMKL